MTTGHWDRETVKGLCRLTSEYWKSGEKKSAFLYLFGIIILTIAAVYMTLLLNDWFNEFYSALQNYDKEAVYHGLVRFTALAFGHIAFSVYAYYLQQTLALRWRRWMTEEYLSRWTSHQMFYRMEMFSGGRSDNPDQRISEDINLFTTRTLSFMSGLLRAVTTISASSSSSGPCRNPCLSLWAVPRSTCMGTSYGRRWPTLSLGPGLPTKWGTAWWASISCSRNWKPISDMPWCGSGRRRKAWLSITAPRRNGAF